MRLTPKRFDAIGWLPLFGCEWIRWAALVLSRVYKRAM